MELAVVNLIATFIYIFYITGVYIKQKKKIMYISIDIEKIKNKKNFYLFYMIYNIFIIIVSLILSVLVLKGSLFYLNILLIPMLLWASTSLFNYYFKNKKI